MKGIKKMDGKRVEKTSRWRASATDMAKENMQAKQEISWREKEMIERQSRIDYLENQEGELMAFLNYILAQKATLWHEESNGVQSNRLTLIDCLSQTERALQIILSDIRRELRKLKNDQAAMNS